MDDIAKKILADAASSARNKEHAEVLKEEIHKFLDQNRNEILKRTIKRLKELEKKREAAVK